MVTKLLTCDLQQDYYEILVQFQELMLEVVCVGGGVCMMSQ